MSDDYDRLVATSRLQERVEIAILMNEWRRHGMVELGVRVSAWIDKVTREAKAAAAESAETDAEP